MRKTAVWTAVLILASAVTYGVQPYTRGVGIYPGNPAEDLAPVLVPDNSTYRNIALLRPAYQSSSYDYNLTAQLVTDGIKETNQLLISDSFFYADFWYRTEFTAPEKFSGRKMWLNIDGSVKWEKSATVDSVEDSVLAPIKMEYPEGLSPVHFLRLKLTRGDKLASENFYWRGVEDGNYQALRSLPKIELQSTTKVERLGSRWVLKTDLNNASKQPALMVRIKAVRAKSGDRILPAYYSDNFISLLPGERRSIVTQIESADTRGESPRIMIEGFNVGGK